MRKTLLSTILVVGLFASATIALADQSGNEQKLLQIIERQNEKIDALLQRVENIEKRQELDAASAATQVVKNQQQDATLDSLTSNVDKIQNLEQRKATR